jgi:hypothetical protein
LLLLLSSSPSSSNNLNHLEACCVGHLKLSPHAMGEHCMFAASLVHDLLSKGCMQAYNEQVEAKINMRIDFRGTKVTCSKGAGPVTSLSPDQVAQLACSGDGSGSGKVRAAKAVLLVVLVFLCIGCIAAAFFVVKRRRNARSFSHHDVPGAASQYVSEVESERTNGTLGGGFVSGVSSGQTYVSGLSEPMAPKKPWGFLPGIRKTGGSMLGSQYVQSTMGDGYVPPEYANGSDSQADAARAPEVGRSPFSSKRTNSKPQLPVSAAQPRGGPVTDITAETASPMSEVSMSGNLSRHKTDTGGRSGGVGLQGPDDEDPERSMNITFNAAYAPGEH